MSDILIYGICCVIVFVLYMVFVMVLYFSHKGSLEVSIGEIILWLLGLVCSVILSPLALLVFGFILAIGLMSYLLDLFVRYCWDGIVEFLGRSVRIK